MKYLLDIVAHPGLTAIERTAVAALALDGDIRSLARVIGKSIETARAYARFARNLWANHVRARRSLTDEELDELRRVRTIDMEQALAEGRRR